MVFLAPVPDSGPAKAITPVLQKYLFFFEFTPNWNFFAPDPGPPPIFADYELMDRNGKVIGSGKWPEEPNPYFLSDRQSRRVAMARFVIATPENEERVMMPWLCRNKKGEHGEEVAAIRLWRSVVKVPTREDFVKKDRHIASDDTIRFLVSTNFCDSKLVALAKEAN